jgi:hypothetical protein
VQFVRKPLRLFPRARIWLDACHSSDAKPGYGWFAVRHRENPMPPLDPHCADVAPDGPALTSYDEEHAITYIRMLAADAEGADWRDVARIVLHIDPDDDSTRARWAYESHLARSKWVVKHGYRLLLRHGERNRDLSRARS